jgi:hypothetical protein
MEAPRHRDRARKDKRTGSARASGEAAIEVHGEVLIEDDGDITRAGLHLARGPSRDAGNLGSADLLKFRHRAIVERNLAEPRAARFQFRGQLVAQIHQSAKIPGADGYGVNSSRQLQRLRQRLVRGAYPNGPPLRYGEPYQREP